MLTGLLWVLAVTPVKLAAPGLQTVGVDAKLGDVYAQRIAVLAQQPGLEIITSSDIQQLIGMERQKALLGCDTAECGAELAGALGVDAILHGSLARSGSSITLTLRVIQTKDGKELTSASVRAANEDELQDWIDSNAKRLGERIVARVRGVPEGDSYPGWIRWALLVGGGGFAVGGGVMLGLAHQIADEASNPPASERTPIATLRSKGVTYEQSSVILFSVGGAALAASALLFFLHQDAPQVSLVVTPGGAAFVWGGRF